MATIEVVDGRHLTDRIGERHEPERAVVGQLDAVALRIDHFGQENAASRVGGGPIGQREHLDGAVGHGPFIPRWIARDLGQRSLREHLHERAGMTFLAVSAEDHMPRFADIRQPVVRPHRPDMAVVEGLPLPNLAMVVGQVEGDAGADGWRVAKRHVVDQHADLLRMERVARHAARSRAAAAAGRTGRIVMCGATRGAMPQHTRSFAGRHRSRAKCQALRRRHEKIAGGFITDRCASEQELSAQTGIHNDVAAILLADDR